jgi:hypothetical protein
MGLIAAQAVGGGKLAAELAQARKHFVGARLAPNLHNAIVFHQVNLVALLQAQLAYKVLGQADRQ